MAKRIAKLSTPKALKLLSQIRAGKMSQSQAARILKVTQGAISSKLKENRPISSVTSTRVTNQATKQVKSSVDGILLQIKSMNADDRRIIKKWLELLEQS